MRGRRPIPTNLKIVSGTQKKHRVNEDEPKPPVVVPEPPDWLTPKQKVRFLDTARKLARMRVMTDADVDAVATYAVVFERMIEASEKLSKDGEFFWDKEKKKFTYHPAWRVFNESEARASRLMAEFGLTPSGRTRVKAT